MKNLVIVGGGVAGLSAGIFALKNGFNVTIYEKNSYVGGNLTGWVRDGLEIDGCIHWLTGTNKLTKTYKKWVEVGALENTSIIKKDTLFTSYYNGQKVSLYRDTKKTLLEMIYLSKQDKKEIISFIKAVEKFKLIMGVGGEFNNKKASIFDLFSFLPYLIKYYKLNLQDLANKFNNKAIKNLFTNFIGGCFSSLAMIITYATFSSGNGDLPKGGSKQMATKMQNKFLSLGGNVVYNKKIISVNTLNNKANFIILDDNSKVYLDYLILTGDAKNIYEDLLSLPIPKKLNKWYISDKCKRFSSFGVAFKVSVNKIPFKGDCSFNIPLKYKHLLKSTHIKLVEYSYDDTFINNGNTVIQSICYLNEKNAENFINLRKNYKEYLSEKKRIALILLECIECLFPTLKGKLKIIDIFTPATYNRYNLSETGSWMAFTFPKKTLPIKCNNVAKPLSNVVIASQWLSPPGGLPVSLDEGERAVKSLVKISKSVQIKQSKLKAVESSG